MNHLRENQLVVIKTAMASGLSEKAARVLAANFSGESLAKPFLRAWDIKQYSQGIAQWSQFRADRIKAHFGKFPKEMSVAEQIKAFLWECKRFYPVTWNALNNNALSAQDQMSAIVKDFERPRNPVREIRTRMKIYAALDKKITGNSNVGAVNGEKPKPS